MNKHALLFGATGLTGSFLLHEICTNASYSSVTVFARNYLSYTHAKLIPVITDLERIYEHGALFTGKDIFCCLGTTIKKVNYDKQAFMKVDKHLPLMIANTASDFSANQLLVISAMGANSSSRFFYNRVKGELENALAANETLPTHIVKPSLLLGARQNEKRWGERFGQIIFPLFSPFLTGHFKAYRPIHAKTVAKAMCNIALLNKKGYNTYDCEQLRLLAKY
jgi:uncharacterized protein YbjT (DUF2867 family)